MGRLTDINFQRIEWCCDDFGIGLEQLSIEAGISQSSLERARDEKAGLTFKQLQRVASFFGRGVLFFFESQLPKDESVHSPQFRTIANQKLDISPNIRKLIERVERQRELYLGLLDEIDADIATFDVPPVPPKDPIKSAEIVREWLGLKGLSAFEDFRLALEEKGCLVFRTNGYKGDWQIPKSSPIMGFSLYDNQNPIILVRKSSSESSQSFTLMHELGHIILHRESSIDDNDDINSYEGIEREANIFAGCVLLPDEELSSIPANELPDQIEFVDDWCKKYRKRWGVSSDVILLRLIQCGLIDSSIYNDFVKWREQQTYEERSGGSREWRHREPIHIFGEGYVRTVLSALSGNMITLNKACGYLDGLKVKDVHKLEGHYARN